MKDATDQVGTVARSLYIVSGSQDRKGRGLSDDDDDELFNARRKLPIIVFPVGR